jgi:two-component system, OmpR family, heavy metal sensor histidine kinase CusS
LSFERERAFNADVAHELRTPLAGIRSIADVTLIRGRDAAEYRQALEECLAIAAKMQAMIDNLLMLARVENGQMKFCKEPIRPAELIETCWRPFADKAAHGGIVFENHVSPTLMCESDTAGLSMIFSNLFDNAAEYTNSGGRIWVTVRKMSDSIEIVLENTGNQLTSEQAVSVFECFWRGDLARSDVGSHCGLGLSLVKRIAESLGGTVRAETSNGLFGIRLTLPHSNG